MECGQIEVRTERKIIGCMYGILKVSKLSEVHGRDVSVVAIEKLLGENQVGSLAGMVRIPEHVLVPI